MNANTAQCSLCGEEVPQSRLHVHRKTETEEMIRYTIDMIRSRHPEWTEGDPSCQMCWDYYGQL